MDMANLVQLLDKAVCILCSINTLGKGMNPTILFSAVDELVRQTGLFNFGMATSLREGKLWIQAC